MSITPTPESKPQTLPGMRCISLWQPWASLVAFEEKFWETRPRRMFGKSIGSVLAIASTKRRPEFFEWTEEGIEIISQIYPRVHAKAEALGWKEGFPDGCVLCVVRVIEELPVEAIRDKLSPQERTFGNYADGRFATRLEMRHRFPIPIPASATNQGIWQWRGEDR